MHYMITRAFGPATGTSALNINPTHMKTTPSSTQDQKVVYECLQESKCACIRWHSISLRKVWREHLECAPVLHVIYKEHKK